MSADYSSPRHGRRAKHKAHGPGAEGQPPEPGQGTENATERESAEDFFEHWFVPSHDQHGHSEREVFRLSESMQRVLQIIIQSGKTPYRTRGDLIRDAIQRHLAKLEEVLPRLGKHFMVGLRLSQQLLQDEAYREELERLFERMENNIQFHLRRGETGEATKQAALQWSQFSAVGDSPWKRNYVERFLRMYGYLLGFRVLGAGLPAPESPAEPKVYDAEFVEEPGEED